jgi:hypothetical protein
LGSSLVLSAAALSLVDLASEEDAPHLRLGSRSSAPRPVAMHRLLDRLVQQRKCFTTASPHVIQISRGASRLTSRLIRLRDARDVLSMRDAAQYLALASHHPSIKANRMQFAQLPTKLCCPKDAKKIFGNFLWRVAKKQNAARSSGAFITSEREVASSHRLDARVEA